MNILFFYEVPIIPHIGGEQRVTDNLTQEFIRRRHKVIFLCPASENQSNDTRHDLSAPQYYVKFDNSGKAGSDIRSIIEEHSIDVIINLFSFNNLDNSLFLFGCTDKQVCKISCIHNDPYHFRGKEVRMAKNTNPTSTKGLASKYFRILFTGAYRNLRTKDFREKYQKIIDASDYLCLLSEKFIPEFIRLTRIPENNQKKIIAINNPNTFTADNEKCEKENIVLYVARLERSQKRPMDFVKVWERLYKKNKEWKAVVVGSGDELDKMIGYASDKGIENIIFEGRKANVKDYFKRAKFICLTSNHEGLPMVLIEGMAYGCVPVAYDTYSSLHDILEDGVCGCATAPFSPGDMALRIQGLIDDEAEFERHSNIARSRVDRFSVTKIVDKWENTIRK